MAIELASGFHMNSTQPLDSRAIAADNTVRNAIPSGVRFQGLTVFVQSTSKNWQLQGGIADANWVDVSTSGGGGGGGATVTGPFTVTDNSSSALSGETTASASYTQVDYVARVLRGTTVFARISFSIFFRNSAWELVLGDERSSGTPSGITFTVHATTGQITAAADLGAGNATITLQKILWAA